MLPLLLATATLDNADRMAQGLDSKPLPYFLALVLAVVGVLWGSLITVAWWGAKGQLALLKSQTFDLKQERDDAQAKLDSERAARLGLAVEVATSAKGLARLREDLDAEAYRLKAKRGPPPGGG